MNSSSYQKLFLLAAIWNLIAGGGMIFMPEFQFQLLFNNNLSEDQFYTKLLFSCFGYSVLLFGLGYYLVSRDIQKNHGVVVIGILGKILVFTTFLLAFIAEKVSMIGFLTAFGDLIWAFAFIFFLFQRKKLVN
jgi:hypothetical protein